MWSKSEIVVSALLLSLTVANLALAKKPKPTPCPPNRYLLPSGISSLTGDSSSDAVPLVLGNGQSSLGSCTLKSGKAKANKKGITTIVARSSNCNGFKKVLVRVSIQSGCQTATVKVKAKKFKLQTLQASRSFCGDGQVDAAAGEQCDGSGCPATATCADSCKCQPIPTTTTTSLPTSTSITTTSTSTTTTTTLVGVCLDIDGNATTQACTSKDACPSNPDGVSGHFACCGDGVRDFGETCDKGLDNCSAGTFCPSDCTSTCTAIGRCTGSGATCLDAATDCPSGQGCCGNGVVEAPESCDDGNTMDGDSCPSTCHIDVCTPVSGTNFGAHVTYTNNAGTAISGIAYSVDYPEGKVSNPTATAPFGVSNSFNDLGTGFTDNAVKLGGLPSSLLTLSFLTCQGAPVATAGDFTCTVTDASDDLGDVVDPSKLTCAVTVP